MDTHVSHGPTPRECRIRDLPRTLTYMVHIWYICNAIPICRISCPGSMLLFTFPANYYKLLEPRSMCSAFRGNRSGKKWSLIWGEGDIRNWKKYSWIYEPIRFLIWGKIFSRMYFTIFYDFINSLHFINILACILGVF